MKIIFLNQPGSFDFYFFKKTLLILHHGDTNFLFYFLTFVSNNIFINNLNDEEISRLMCEQHFKTIFSR